MNQRCADASEKALTPPSVRRSTSLVIPYSVPAFVGNGEEDVVYLRAQRQVRVDQWCFDVLVHAPPLFFTRPNISQHDALICEISDRMELSLQDRRK